MVDNTDSILKLNIKFEDKEEEMILKELVSIEKLKNIFIEKYKIPKNKVKNFDLCYYDKEGDIVSFEDNDNLYDLSSKESDSTYVLNLELFFYEGDSRIQSMRFSSRKCLNINNNKQTCQSKKIDNKNNENKNDNNNELEKQLLNKKKENEELKKEINRMNKKRIEELNRKINEIKNRKRKTKESKQEIEKKLIELKNIHKEKIEQKKELEIIKINKYLNELKNII